MRGAAGLTSQLPHRVAGWTALAGRRAPGPSDWSLADIPDLTGTTVVVTGASPGGLGEATALELARHRARVVLAGRSAGKLGEAAAGIRDQVAEARLEVLLVDLADLSSVRRAAAESARLGPIDVLVNNAGVMAPAYQRTVDGFELQMATNHFGPFLLTGLLLPQLAAAGGARVVTVASQMHRIARRAPTGDPREEQVRYLRWPAYGESKLANLLFTFELDRRLRESDVPVRALAAHPGFAGSHLVVNGQVGRAVGAAPLVDAAVRAVSQSVADGALPTLMATTADLPGGTYCGPAALAQLRGRPRVVDASALAHDRDAQRRLWEVSEKAVGLTYP